VHPVTGLGLKGVIEAGLSWRAL